MGTRVGVGLLGGSTKIAQQFVVSNKLGLHARPASLFVRTASRFDATIAVSRDGHVSDGKSVLALLMLGAGQGTALEITADGADAAEAMAAIRDLLAEGFGEE
ncbi:MAG: HPr family phosphocarrier protein [Lentisphaerae bacterium]|nr:HPr family phosphocarrier protein [Lentisphaerota bacterium]MBT4819435.1 HPr family phosphocarrier protein [Lentisphaerota bacterium]MBT5608427.1 HPr family phosphocarrier protein [Lentisphaerota bacterium]MBT7055045.1 HPr family phosphocarrier protein [Lentisphaerota bacterium]MBT7847765.1 HPr family phosphocarrier protein [Lentisphaerota bacterium]